MDNFLQVIKQSIMTTVYGVTEFGARAQIRRQLEDLPDFPREQLMAASTYLCDKTMLCLREMFTSARLIQDWFWICAHIISSTDRDIAWTTPIGFTALQYYRKPKKFVLTEEDKVAFGLPHQRHFINIELVHAFQIKYCDVKGLFADQLSSLLPFL